MLVDGVLTFGVLSYRFRFFTFLCWFLVCLFCAFWLLLLLLFVRFLLLFFHLLRFVGLFNFLERSSSCCSFGFYFVHVYGDSICAWMQRLWMRLLWRMMWLLSLLVT